MVAPVQAQNLRDAFNAFDPTHPLRDEWYERFYVERPQGTEKLLNDLLADERATTKWLFTGHRGSGKSTELIRLCEALKDRYFTVYYTVEDSLNMADIDYKDVLLSLGSQLYAAAKEQKVRLSKRLLENLEGWLTTTIKEVEMAGEAGAGVEAKADFFFLNIFSRLQSQTTTRQQIRTQMESTLADLLEAINAIVKAIREKRGGQQVLVIIDGLDKVMDLDQALRMYYAGGVNLLVPECKVVYTVPLAMFYTTEFGQIRATFDDFFVLPNIKLQTREGRRLRAGWDMLNELIERRMAPHLITARARRQLVNYSGGLLRELVSLAKDACSNARARGGERVELQDVERAANKVRNVYRTLLTAEHYRELWRVQHDPRKQQTNSPISQELIHNLSLLEYRNDDSWWDVHPIVAPLLEERADELAGTAPGTG